MKLKFQGTCQPLSLQNILKNIENHRKYMEYEVYVVASIIFLHAFPSSSLSENITGHFYVHVQFI
jgi:hypothetical protein